MSTAPGAALAVAVLVLAGVQLSAWPAAVAKTAEPLFVEVMVAEHTAAQVQPPWAK